MTLKIKPPKAYPVPNADGLKSTYAWHPGMRDYDGIGKVILRVSKSSLGAFQFCQQQYFIKYVLGVKEPSTDDMTRGTNVHDAVEDFYNNLDVEKASRLEDTQDIYDYFRSQIPTSSKEKEWGGVITPSAPFALDEGQHLDRFMKAEAVRFANSDSKHFIPSGNEITKDVVVSIDVGNTSVLVHLTGIIDRVFTDEEGRLHIHELKTGVWKLNNKLKLEGMRKEMAFYTYMIQKSDGIETSFWGWDHTKGVKDSGEDRIYRFIEPVQIAGITGMLKDLTSLVESHMAYFGGYSGDSYEILSGGAERFICEPWCRVKGYCPKYERALMPYDMKQQITGDAKND